MFDVLEAGRITSIHQKCRKVADVSGRKSPCSTKNVNKIKLLYLKTSRRELRRPGVPRPARAPPKPICCQSATAQRENVERYFGFKQICRTGYLKVPKLDYEKWESSLGSNEAFHDARDDRPSPRCFRAVGGRCRSERAAPPSTSPRAPPPE